MAKSTEELAPDSAKFSKMTNFIKHLIVKLILVAIIAGGGWYLYKNPALLQPKQENEILIRIESQIGSLQSQMNVLRTENEAKVSAQDIASLNEKIENVSKINTELLDSKASNAAILGLISRVDDLEIKVKGLSKISSQGALILTAAMLVKDGADQGRPFEYEAEVLRQLALGTNMETAAETIAQYASEGIVPQEGLIVEFDRLYSEREAALEAAEKKQEQPDVASEVQPATGWKEKINSKLSKLIMIEYHDGQETVVSEVNVQDEIYTLVHQKKMQQAAAEMAGNPFYQTEGFVKWQQQAKAEDAFNRALKRIQALTLAVIKAENLKAHP